VDIEGILCNIFKNVSQRWRYDLHVCYLLS